MSDPVSTDADSSAAARNHRPTVIGTVVSDRMQKTIVVRRDRQVKHPLYKKYVKSSSKLTAHDEDNAARSGDIVEIAQTRPLSKSKRWRLVRILREAPGAREAVTAATAPSADGAEKSGEA